MQEVRAQKNVGTVRLKMGISDLNEVEINKGYYTTTKKLNTGSISTVSADEIAHQPVTDFLAALQGKVPGLFIQQLSGAPGRSFTVRLRGQNSIANGNDPLYIVDGVPFGSNTLNSSKVNTGAGMSSSPFADINPADIESIQILKDADATAIYGSRGANGVILITTKRGKAGKNEISANFYAGAGEITRDFDLLNTDQYLNMRRAAFKNDSRTPGPTDYDLNGTFDENRYTDWQKVFIGGTASTIDGQVAISGGKNLTKYRISGGYHKEGTVYPGNFYTERGSGQLSINNVSENKKFKIDVSGSFGGSTNKLPNSDLVGYILLTPNAPEIYNPDGSLNWAGSSWENPFSEIMKRNKEISRNLIANGVLSYEVVPGLILRSSLGYNSRQFRQSQIIPYTALDPVIFDDPKTSRSHSYGNNNISTWIVEPQLQYGAEFLGGKFEALVGTTIQTTEQKAESYSTTGYSSDELLENLLAASYVMITGNPSSSYRYHAGYGRIGYTFKDRYVLNLTGRRDGSSRFGPGRQFGNFGAIGAAWIFGKERFITENFKFLTYGKLRGSIGSTGNDKLQDYQYLSTYSAYGYGYQGNNSLYPTQLTNPLFGWERVNKIEFGLELGFLQDRAFISISLYRNRTNNQLVGYTLPAISGFTSVQANLPAVVQNKGLEIEINGTPVDGKRLRWNTSFNVSVPRNKLISYPNLEGSSYATTYAVGMPLNVQFLYQHTGIDPATKLYTFEDINKDGAITLAGDRRPTVVGVDFFGGWTNSITYRNWQLDLLINFTKQESRAFLFSGLPGAYAGGLGNQPITVINGSYPQPFSLIGGSINSQRNFFVSSTGILTDASFIRLRNVSLAWRLPNAWAAIKGKLFIQCQNLLTITNYKGLDPESAGFGTYRVPPLRMLTAGFQLNL